MLLVFVFDYYCYRCMYICIYIKHVDKAHIPAESVFVVYVYMVSRLTILHWTPNMGAHQWRG